MFLRSIYMKALAAFVAVVFTTDAMAAELALPLPGTPVSVSQSVTPATVKGLVVNPNDPLALNFVLDSGESSSVSKDEVKTFAEYFLAALSVPTEDIWVNLSPYEQDRVMEDSLAQTALGKVFLEKDYILKQLSATLTDPADELGKTYWKALNDAGVSASEAFTKIWISPATVEVTTRGNAMYILDLPLKVQTEDDYLAGKGAQVDQHKASDIVKTTILPMIEKEVNTGDNFKQLRQVMHAVVLAVWFKSKVKGGMFDAYIGTKNVKGIDVTDPAVRDQVFSMYVDAFKKGVYDKTVKETDNGRKLKRHYFSGGIATKNVEESIKDNPAANPAFGASSLMALVTLKQPGAASSGIFSSDTAKSIVKFMRKNLWLTMTFSSLLGGGGAYVLSNLGGISAEERQKSEMFATQKSMDVDGAKAIVNTYVSFKTSDERINYIQGLATGMLSQDVLTALVRIRTTYETGILEIVGWTTKEADELDRLIGEIASKNPMLLENVLDTAKNAKVDSTYRVDVIEDYFTNAGFDTVARAALTAKYDEYKKLDSAGLKALDSLAIEQAKGMIGDTTMKVNIAALTKVYFENALKDTSDNAFADAMKGIRAAYKQIDDQGVVNTLLDSLKGADFAKGYRALSNYRLGIGSVTYSFGKDGKISHDLISVNPFYAIKTYDELVGRFKDDSVQRALAIDALIAVAMADLGANSRAGQKGINAATTLFIALGFETDPVLAKKLDEFVNKKEGGYEGALSFGPELENQFKGLTEILQVRNPDRADVLKKNLDQTVYFKVVNKGKPGKVTKPEIWGDMDDLTSVEPESSTEWIGYQHPNDAKSIVVEQVAVSSAITAEKMQMFGDVVAAYDENGKTKFDQFLAATKNIALDPNVLANVLLMGVIGSASNQQRINAKEISAFALKDKAVRDAVAAYLKVNLDVLTEIYQKTHSDANDVLSFRDEILTYAYIFENADSDDRMGFVGTPEMQAFIVELDTLTSGFDNTTRGAVMAALQLRTIPEVAVKVEETSSSLNGGIAATDIRFSGTDTIKIKNVDLDFSMGITPVVSSIAGMPAAVKTFDDLVKTLVS